MKILSRASKVKISRPYTQEDFQKRVDKICTENAKKEAFRYMRDDGTHVSTSFEEVYEGIIFITEALKESGIKKGDRVALISPLSPSAVLAGVSLGYSGVVVVLIDPTLPKEEINRLLMESDVRGAFATNKMYEQLDSDIVCQIPVFCINAAETSVKRFTSSASKVLLEETPDRHFDVAAILFSSGTTASMKGIMLTWHSVMRSRDLFADVSGMSTKTSYLVVFPYNHVSGYSSTMMYFLTGCSMGMIENVNASKLAEGLQSYMPHHFGMVPKVYDVMADKIRAAIHEKGVVAEKVINSLITFCGFVRRKTGIRLGKYLLGVVYKKVFGKNICGLAILGTPCAKETAELFLNFGIEWANMYATTETNAFISCTGLHDRYPENSVGNICRYEEDIVVRINNPDEKGIGEVYVKSSLMMKGYFRDEELTLAAFEDGFFKTGDLGYLDKKGDLYICGRSKDTIMLHNGKKISATDVDAYYQKIAGAITVASCAIPAEDGYDELHLFLEQETHNPAMLESCKVLVKDKSLEEDSLYRLAGIHFIDKIPVTSVGKVKRYLLKERVANALKISSVNVITKNMTVEESIYTILSRYIDVNSGPITEKADLKKDLGIDSLHMFEIVCEISEKLHVEVAGLLEDVSTVGDLIATVMEPKQKQCEMNLAEFPKVKTERELKRLDKWIGFFRNIYKFEVTGLGNVPQNSNFIISSNHINNLDPIWLVAAMKGYVPYENIGCLAAVHLFKKKVTRKLFETMGGIPVDRFGNTVPAIARCKECLQGGMNLIIFPEGARSRDGQMLPFKNGIAKLSRESDTPILPVRIDGGFEVFPRNRMLPRLFNWKKMSKYNLKITIAPPIYPQDKTETDIVEQLRVVTEGLLIR